MLGDFSKVYSGFISARRTVSAIGIHQRFDMAAFRMVEPYLVIGSFPTLKQVLHFEGINGPDGLKVKSPGKNEPSHLYNPLTDIGPIPEHIKGHYDKMVGALQENDDVRAAFEAAWMAHYICDGLTPAHHFPLEERLAEYAARTKNTVSSMFKHRVKDEGDSALNVLRKQWALWGSKGLLSTHFNFEMGVALALVGTRIKGELDSAKLATATQIGPIDFFKQEAREIAELDLYGKFYDKGWNSEMARLIKNRLAPQTAQTIGIMWLLAYLEAEKQTVKKLPKTAQRPKPKRQSSAVKQKA
jgi:hypothetical protein